MPLSPMGGVALGYLGLLVIFFLRGQSHAIHTVRKQRNGLFVLESQKKIWQHMQLQGDSLSTPFGCVLYFRPEEGGRLQPVIIWADSVPPDVFRRLRGWLNWCAQCAE